MPHRLAPGALLLALFAVALPRPEAPASTAPDRGPGAAAWVVTPRGSGSSCLIDRQRGLLLTNAHVARDFRDVHVVFPLYRNGALVSGRAFYRAHARRLAVPARVLHVDRKRDLALVEVGRVPATAREAPLAARPPRPGERLYRVSSPALAGAEAWGHASGEVKQVSHESFRYPDGTAVSGRMVLSTLPGRPGDSGAGVLNERGELVAVHAAERRRDRLAVSVSVDEVRAFLREARRATAGR
jgi:S1-C subfamily serine protease